MCGTRRRSAERPPKRSTHSFPRTVALEQVSFERSPNPPAEQPALRSNGRERTQQRWRTRLAVFREERIPARLSQRRGQTKPFRGKGLLLKRGETPNRSGQEAVERPRRVQRVFSTRQRCGSESRPPSAGVQEEWPRESMQRHPRSCLCRRMLHRREPAAKTLPRSRRGDGGGPSSTRLKSYEDRNREGEADGPPGPPAKRANQACGQRTHECRSHSGLSLPRMDFSSTGPMYRES